MLVRDLALNGRVVEFGLRLGDGRTLPIDSKWPAADLLVQLDRVGGDERIAAAREIEREVERRIREAAQYILPGHTTPYALVALPDAALACCTSAYREAQKRSVLLMSYSMAVPYLLALYRLHLEYAGSLDIERVRAQLIDIERGLGELDAILENRLARAATMTQNAYFEAKQVTARLRATANLGERELTAPGPE
jgi:DNA recombination protein RmuC